MNRFRPPNLKLEIVIVLLVKAALIFAIWFLFFNHPTHPGAEDTARALLDQAPMARNPTHE
jgi:lipopolysaccharide export LptBFGC system permease protein LptF